jgi:hypothetical protein
MHGLERMTETKDYRRLIRQEDIYRYNDRGRKSMAAHNAAMALDTQCMTMAFGQT